MELAGTKAITKMWAKIKAYIATKLASYLPLSGGTLTGDLLFSDSGTTIRQIRGTAGGNDAWRVAGGATEVSSTGSGWMEIATADDGNEPIYVRQYTCRGNIAFYTIARSATLLDASGNTLFPGTVTASAFSGNASSATKLATARSITLSGNTTGTATFDGSANITISTSTNCASEAKTLTSFCITNYGTTNSYGLIVSLPLPYNSSYWGEITSSIYVSYNHNYANEKFGLIRLKASGMGKTDGGYGYYSALQLGNLDSSVVRFSYVAPTASASGSLNVYAYGSNYAQIVVTSLTNNVSIHDGGFTLSSIPGVEFYLSDMYMPNAISNRTKGTLTITENGTSVGAFNGSANTTIALTDTTYSDATTTTHGLMTATDKVKLNGISSDGSNYSGNAASATKAVQDGNGNVIADSYLIATRIETSYETNTTGKVVAFGRYYSKGSKSNVHTAFEAFISAAGLAWVLSDTPVAYSNRLKSSAWDWEGSGPTGTGSRVLHIATISGLGLIHIKGIHSAGASGYMDIIDVEIGPRTGSLLNHAEKAISDSSLAYVRGSSIDKLDLYVKEAYGTNYYQMSVVEMIAGAAIVWDTTSSAVTAPTDLVSIT